jgi:hypothetical protein
MVGLIHLPLVGGLCLTQQTLTTKVLKDMPLVRGLCLAQRASTTRVSGICPSLEELSRTVVFDHKVQQNVNKPQQQMRKPVTNRVREDCEDSQTMNICSKA